jgi:hypothetical protein
MIRFILAVTLLWCGLTDTTAQWKHFSIYVDNVSNFDIKCLGKTEKGGGIFAKYSSGIKAHQKTLFVVDGEKGLFPKGVEGTVAITLPGYDGHVILYFDNPGVGSPKFEIQDVTYPFYANEFSVGDIQEVIVLKEKAVAVRINVDTANDHKPPVPLPATGNSKPVLNMDEPIPPVINFDWQVTQRMHKDEDDENNGKAYKEVTYFFTNNGDYAAVKPEDKSISLMIYSKKGHTWIFDDKKKTITVMNMPKTVGEGGVMGKEIAEKINKAPLKKHYDDEEKFTITKTGKTKNILGYTADEYEMKNNKIITSSNASKTGTMSLWYAKVPFDPVKIYTMGVGRPADISKIQNDPKMKNNMFAIPVLNKNYLWVETEAGGKTGMEVTEIKRVNNTIYTAGYKIKVMKSLKDMLKGDEEN